LGESQQHLTSVIEAQLSQLLVPPATGMPKISRNRSLDLTVVSRSNSSLSPKQVLGKPKKRSTSSLSPKQIRGKQKKLGDQASQIVEECYYSDFDTCPEGMLQSRERHDDKLAGANTTMQELSTGDGHDSESVRLASLARVSQATGENPSVSSSRPPLSRDDQDSTKRTTGCNKDPDLIANAITAVIDNDSSRNGMSPKSLC